MKYVFIFIVMTTLFGCTANKSVVEVSQNISEQIEKPFHKIGMENGEEL